ncbi:MAG: radical SAM protein [Candidatus Bathyarchaeia archaeon]
MAYNAGNKFLKVYVDRDKCLGCGFCSEFNVCVNDSCVGCLSCYYACPHQARVVVEEIATKRIVRVIVDGEIYNVPDRITIKRALELCGYSFSVFHSEGGLQAPCNLGGCYACAVHVDGKLTRSCITAVKDGMKIETEVSSAAPLRIVHGPSGHTVGGKATPWTEGKGLRYIEVAVWVAGCNLRCPQCQNYHVTYDNHSAALTPREAAELLTAYRRKYGVKGLAISGGEPTLNKPWLIQYFRELKRLNMDVKARLHLDSNGTLLTPSYIDELVEAGCNNIGVEPKGVRLETFMKITGIGEKEIAKKYLDTSWNASKYLIENYGEKVYTGIGVPYNPAFISYEELVEIGDKIAGLNSSIQVCVLDYFPAFRRSALQRPSYSEMIKVKKILNERGLKHVIVQTEFGHIGP